MQTKPKTKAQTQTRKTFEWGVRSTTIDFMRTSTLEAVRDGSQNDCGCVSQIPNRQGKKPRRKTQQS